MHLLQPLFPPPRHALAAAAAALALLGAVLSSGGAAADARATVTDFVTHTSATVRRARDGALLTAVHKRSEAEAREAFFRVGKDVMLGRRRDAKNMQDTNWCPEKSYFDFVPVPTAVAYPNKTVSFNGACFGDMSATLRLAADFASIEIDAQEPASFACGDAFLIANREQLYFHEFLEHGQHIIHLGEYRDNEMQDLLDNGMGLYRLPCGMSGSVESLYKTYEMFNGNDLQKANAEFLSYKMKWPIQSFGKQVQIDPKNVRSGDYLAIMRFDGLDPTIAFGIGGHTGHSAIAVWEGDQLYVCESTDANPFGPVYWPPPYGIIRTPFQQWYSQAIKANYLVAILPLTADMASKFNETSYWEFFFKVQYMPYGYHNFLFSFLDTYPLQNLPQPINGAMLDMAFNTWWRFQPSTEGEVTIYSLLIQGLNHRLNTQCTDMPCINVALKAGNLELAQVAAMPEQDSWKYGYNYSMVCSVFAFEGWKAAFGTSLPLIQGTEQTPKDNYQLAIFDGSFWNDNNCPGGVQQTPQGTYCQLLGTFVLPLNDYNTVPIYAHMNERCPAQWPSYQRCPPGQLQCC